MPHIGISPWPGSCCCRRGQWEGGEGGVCCVHRPLVCSGPDLDNKTHPVRQQQGYYSAHRAEEIIPYHKCDIYKMYPFISFLTFIRSFLDAHLCVGCIVPNWLLWQHKTMEPGVDSQLHVHVNTDVTIMNNLSLRVSMRSMQSAYKIPFPHSWQGRCYIHMLDNPFLVRNAGLGNVSVYITLENVLSLNVRLTGTVIKRRAVTTWQDVCDLSTTVTVTPPLNWRDIFLHASKWFWGLLCDGINTLCAKTLILGLIFFVSSSSCSLTGR